MTSLAASTSRPSLVAPPTRFVTIVGILVALWCAGFAAISVWFEVTGYFDSGEYADYASGFSVANWLVTVLKLVGVAIALLAIARRPHFLPPWMVGTALWAAFATTGVYVFGSIVQAVLMLTGVTGDADKIDAASTAYVLLFLVAAAGFGILAFSYAGRAGLGRREMLLGAVGAPVLLGGLLIGLPALLVALGLFPGDAL